MVKIKPPTINGKNISDAEKDHNLEGLFVDVDECNINPERLEEIKRGTVSRVDRSQTGETLQPIRFGSTDKRETEDGVELFEIKIDFEDLWKMMYEHRQYASSRGFSNCEMRVLKAMREINRDRITAKEIKEYDLLSDYSGGAVHNSLDNLIDKELVKREQRGIYSLIDI